MERLARNLLGGGEEGALPLRVSPRCTFLFSLFARLRPFLCSEVNSADPLRARACALPAFPPFSASAGWVGAKEARTLQAAANVNRRGGGRFWLASRTLSPPPRPCSRAFGRRAREAETGMHACAGAFSSLVRVRDSIALAAVAGTPPPPPPTRLSQSLSQP